MESGRRYNSGVFVKGPFTVGKLKTVSVYSKPVFECHYVEPIITETCLVSVVGITTLVDEDTQDFIIVTEVLNGIDTWRLFNTILEVPKFQFVICHRAKFVILVEKNNLIVHGCFPSEKQLFGNQVVFVDRVVHLNQNKVAFWLRAHLNFFDF